MNQFQFFRATTQKSAIDILTRETDAQFIAGGTNLIDLMKKGVVNPQKLVDINNLSLKNIEKQKGGLRIGALASNSEVAMHGTVIKEYPLLSQALQAGASPQLRNMATVGGNILQRTRCSYFYDTSMPCNKRHPGTGCGALKGYNRMHAIFGASDHCIAVHPSDMCVALAALNAMVIVAGSKGERRIPFNDFHRLPGDHPEKDTVLQRGELIVAVDLPTGAFTRNIHYLKIRDRASYAFALISVAAALEISDGAVKDARLAMGGVAHKPWRLLAAEKFLIGKPASAASFRKAAEMAMQDAKAYEHNAFKLKLAPNAIVEALQKASEKV